MLKPQIRLAPFIVLFALGALFDALYYLRWRPEFDFYRNAAARRVTVESAETQIEPDRCGGKACAHLWVAQTRLALRDANGEQRIVGEAYADKKPYAETRAAALKALVGSEVEFYLSEQSPGFFAERAPLFPWLPASTLLLVSTITMLPLMLALRARRRG